MSLRSDASALVRYVRDVQQFWRTPPDWEPAVGTIRRWLAERDDAFLRMVRRAIYAHPASPYLRLLNAAGIGLEDVERLTRAHGVEGCLRRLHEAGVYVSLDEFKGRRPIRRLGLDVRVTPADFRPPWRLNSWDVRSGGSRSAGTRIPSDPTDKLQLQPAYALHAQAHGYARGPWAQWWAAPPGAAGMARAQRHVKLGQPLLRWFSPTHAAPGRASGASAAITLATVALSPLSGYRVPYPRYTPMDRADIIARWLARQKARRGPIVFDTMASAAVRIARAAEQLGLDISGHLMRTGGEPLTPGKVAALERVGLRYCSQYGSTEAKTMGLSCGDPQAYSAAGSLVAPGGQTARDVRIPDDMHLLTFALAFIQHRMALEGWPEPVDALLVTRFSPRVTPVLLNLELGDYGVLVQRDCGCPLGEAGLTTHLHTIRSYEKLTSAGMHFMGADLHDVLEVALPARFGGGPIDYQFVERERGGQTTLSLVIHPAVGPLDEREVIRFTLDELERRTKSGRMMTDIWRQEDVLHVERAAPHLTRAAKIQPLHVEHGPP